MKSLTPVCMFFLSSLLWDGVLFAQQSQVQFQHLAVTDGLSDNTVNAITQDKYGFIWIATVDGLNRFDGYRVEAFTHEITNPLSLPSDRITCLYSDIDGNLWIGTDEGLSRFNFNNHSFYNFKHNPTNKNSIPSNVIRKITGDDKGFIWIATNQGLCCFDKNKKQFTTLSPSSINEDQPADNNIIDIANDNEGHLWVLTPKLLSKLTLSTTQLISWRNVLDDTIKEISRGSIAVDHQNKIWLCNDEKAAQFNPASGVYERFFTFDIKKLGHSNLYIRNIFVDKSGKIWLAAQPLGCGYLSGTTDTFQFIKHDALLNTSLAANNARCIFEDRDGLIYIGSDHGMDRFNPAEKKFDLYRSFNQTIPRQWFRVFCEDSLKNLWIATSGSGVYVLNRKNNSVINYCNIPGKPTSLSENSVRSLYLDKHGIMWVGTAHGLNRFNDRLRTFKTYLPENTNGSLPGDFIWAIVNDDKGNLWIATNHGLCYYDYVKDKFSNFSGDTAKQALNRSISAIYIDKEKDLWLSVNINGSPLARYNASTGKVITWRHNGDDTTSIAGNNVYSITQDNDGVMWFGTSGGLSRYNKSQNNFTTYTTKNGLPNNHVAELIFDKRGNLWMSTNNGICMMNKSGTRIKTFDESDGLQGKEFNLQSAYETGDGEFCFSGYDGFNMFNPDSFRYNLQPPPVVLRSVKIFDKYLTEDSAIFSLKPMKLSYRENFFTFEFAALNYDHPERNHYRCQLTGFDKEMITLGNSRTISYTNVPPGKYTLKVIASNNDGVWNRIGIDWTLIITPPFWQTWWFYSLYALAICTAVFLLYNMRINQFKRELSIRNKIARDLHDDVGSTLSSLNMVSALAMKRLRDDPVKIRGLLEKITETSERMTGKMQDIVWAVNPLNDSFAQITARMQEFASQILELKNIDLTFTVDQKSRTLKVPLRYRNDLFMIFKEAINNVAKYSQATHTWVSIKRNNKMIFLEIRDNGSGFDASKIKKGNGLMNMRERAKSFNGTLAINSGNDGTTILLAFRV